MILNNSLKEVCLIITILIGIISNIDCRLAEPTEEPLNQIITTETLAPSTTTTVKPQTILPECFHQPSSICAQLFNSNTNGHCTKYSSKAVICCNINTNLLAVELQTAGVGPTADIESLHIINATLDVLNVTHKSWKRLKSMSVTDGNIKRVVGSFTKQTSISCLNLSSNGILEIEKRSFVNLIDLTTLDLSNNKLDTIPNFGTKSANLSLDVSDNKQLQCLSLHKAMVDTKKELIFQNQNRTLCVTKLKSFHWFNSTEQVPFAQMELSAELALSCPRPNNNNCTCKPHRLVLMKNDSPKYAIRVDCSNLNLTSLPTPLPPYTYSLNVSHNKIESLKMLSEDPYYQDLRELYADYNEITSISILEGTKFIDNFALLSLRANKLKSLPTYFLSNTFDRTYDTPRLVYLGLNYLTCDCNTFKTVKIWLTLKQKNIPDYDEIWCENLPLKVYELVQSKVCQHPRDWTDYIYYIIATEVLLLVGLICKVSYDYWIFKTAGYLPWPASKMPKLPCDCLCET